jgi:uncharacterized protein (DUF952 family)
MARFGRDATREPLFHLALPDDWAAAQASGSYEMSTRGASLADVGFIHLSYAHQWPRVRDAFYSDVTELVLLEIDPVAIAANIVVEVGHPETGEEFPHLYAALPTSAVIDTTPVGGTAY